MTVNYVGASNDYPYRVAEILWDDESHKEETLVKRLVFFLERIHGWSVQIVCPGYGIVQVSDRDEFKMFMQDYKAGKRMILNCLKYGF